MKFESQMIKINLIGNNEKDYYISCTFMDYSIDIFDIYNKKMSSQSKKNFFGNLSWYSKYFSILELANENKTYLFCFLAKRSDSFYLYFQKFQFYNIDLSQSQNYKKIYSKEYLEVKESFTITCFEIVKYNLIQCFYIDLENYLTLGLFNESNLELILTESIDDRANTNNLNTENHFYKSILFKNEISILGYKLDASNYIYLQIKNVIYNNKNSTFEIENYLNFQNLTLNPNITM